MTRDNLSGRIDALIIWRGVDVLRVLGEKITRATWDQVRAAPLGTVNDLFGARRLLDVRIQVWRAERDPSTAS